MYVLVSVQNGGLRFVHFVKDEEPLCDELVITSSRSSNVIFEIKE